MKYLTTKELAQLFGRAPETIRYWIRSCRLARYGQRFGREWLFTPESVLAFIEEEMSRWYAKKQWHQARKELEYIKECLKGDGHPAISPVVAQHEVEFKSYKMGKIRGQLRRKELYRGR